jgi:hypothetical protein
MATRSSALGAWSGAGRIGGRATQQRLCHVPGAASTNRGNRPPRRSQTTAPRCPGSPGSPRARCARPPVRRHAVQVGVVLVAQRVKPGGHLVAGAVVHQPPVGEQRDLAGAAMRGGASGQAGRGAPPRLGGQLGAGTCVCQPGSGRELRGVRRPAARGGASPRRTWSRSRSAAGGWTRSRRGRSRARGASGSPSPGGLGGWGWRGV